MLSKDHEYESAGDEEEDSERPPANAKLMTTSCLNAEKPQEEDCPC